MKQLSCMSDVTNVRMAEWSKVLRSGRSVHTRVRVRISGRQKQFVENKTYGHC